MSPPFSRIQANELLATQERARAEFESCKITAGDEFVAQFHELTNSEHEYR